MSGVSRSPPARCDQRKAEIDSAQHPQIEPIGPHLAQAGAHLIDADEAVDRRFTRKHPAHRVEERRDHLARPGNADEKKLQQYRHRENRTAVSRCLKTPPVAWPIRLVASANGPATAPC